MPKFKSLFCVKAFYFCVLALVSFVVLGGVFWDYYIRKTGTTILVPLYKGAVSDGFFSLNYRNMIPERQLKKEDGTIVVYVNSFGVVSFVRPYDKEKELDFGEHLLDYRVYRAPSLFPTKPKVYFASQSYKVSNPDFEAKKVSYAVLKVSKSGQAILVGLADTNYNLIQ